MFYYDIAINTSCNNLSHFVCNFSNFSPFVTNIEEERKVMNDERREHGAVDESSLEWQICESDNHTLIVRKNWSPSTSGTGSYISQASRLAGW